MYYCAGKLDLPTKLLVPNEATEAVQLAAPLHGILAVPEPDKQTLSMTRLRWVNTRNLHIRKVI